MDAHGFAKTEVRKGGQHKVLSQGIPNSHGTRGWPRVAQKHSPPFHPLKYHPLQPKKNQILTKRCSCRDHTLTPQTRNVLELLGVFSHPTKPACHSSHATPTQNQLFPCLLQHCEPLADGTGGREIPMNIPHPNKWSFQDSYLNTRYQETSSENGRMLLVPQTQTQKALMVEAMHVGMQEAAPSDFGLCTPTPGSCPVPGEQQREQSPC